MVQVWDTEDVRRVAVRFYLVRVRLKGRRASVIWLSEGQAQSKSVKLRLDVGAEVQEAYIPCFCGSIMGAWSWCWHTALSVLRALLAERTSQRRGLPLVWSSRSHLFGAINYALSIQLEQYCNALLIVAVVSTPA